MKGIILAGGPSNHSNRLTNIEYWNFPSRNYNAIAWPASFSAANFPLGQVKWFKAGSNVLRVDIFFSKFQFLFTQRRHGAKSQEV
ncbi:MAG: hypothetical protein A2W25_00630 [candidate division Zixibacteria bacterium RBG_16_53_22]|nr:MAG: hypothetical protein A2W25_00630 [candidate division Zixibacteria bacterium RBG_16_53_22]